MALKKQTKLDKIEIVMTDAGYPVVQIREAVSVLDTATGEAIGGKTYHRQVVMPDVDVADQPADVQAIAKMLFTPAVKAAYKKHQDKVAASDAVPVDPPAAEPAPV
jgi:hypothetical protein